MGEELAKKAKEEMIKYDPDLFGEETIDKGGLSISYVKLAQKATDSPPEGVRPGDFFTSVGGVNLGTKIVFNVIKAGRQRVKFTSDKKIECKSLDAVHGSVEGRLCATCPFAKWNDDREWRRQNYCPPVEVSLIVLENDTMPAILPLSKMREITGRKLRTQLVQYTARNKILANEQKTPIVFYKFAISSFKEANEFGTYGCSLATVGRETDPDRQALLIEIFQSFKKYQGDVAKFSEQEPAPTTSAEPEAM